MNRSDEADSTRRLKIAVLDSEGKPVTHANMLVAMADAERPLAIDAQGMAFLDLPTNSASMHLTVRASHYVPVEVHWFGQDIPDEFTFHLDPGLPLGGLVQDERGQPIAGVTVSALQVSSRVARNGVVVPAIGGEIAITDAQGKWRADIATNEPFDLRLQLKHPEYFSDPRFRQAPCFQHRTPWTRSRGNTRRSSPSSGNRHRCQWQNSQQS